ncbi:hypothetical protein AM493_08180 [Flavobacterium akiainvivens]|uniref:Membrane receptor RagA n=1 Tax=Flavobacterium akiainvivens TaxID=1202724 RepID=A0A0M9VHW3_9FLAO|nr:DUF5686 and carboxypeptidase regulatory-like domain-containing protein [Flavobacterium akiainvivens]KOS06016.1 hypothetical protein AM493_08180 [Flavobacterium akiainvivens]SFQ54250.1 CarboxypepD_reg-like domain-containing protein [Flavobacterium akiainvivens]
MKQLAVILFLLLGYVTVAQVKGRVTDAKGNPVPYTAITVQGTYTGTSSNENGFYQLELAKGKYILVFRSIGFKTKEIAITVTQQPLNQNITLEAESYTLQELVIGDVNPAKDFITSAIKARKANAAKTAEYEADFYSRGVMRLKNVPKSILGQEIGDLGASIDTTTHEGILYLSETVSHIKYKDGRLNERVVASKTSGDDEYSYNNADAANFDLYQNYLPFQVNVISPIADNALNYYDYQQESTFKDAGGQLVSKIKVTPKSTNTPTVSGYIYIVNNTWEVYAAELTVLGSNIRQPLLNTLTIRQNYSYNTTAKLWSKSVQVVEFELSLLDVKSLGTFTYVYSNYNYSPGFTRDSLTAEIQYFEPEGNTRPDSYWAANRRIPLTPEEQADYAKKGRLEELAKTKSYQDSIDRGRNRFNWTSPILGYTYRNTYDKWQLNFIGIARRLAFNTVQAYWLGPGASFTKFHDNNGYTTVGADLNYGFAEKRLRATGYITHKFNNITKRTVTLSGGSSIEQFNPEKPINKIVNSISTLFFRDNYMKLYDNNFLRVNYEEEVLNGLYLYGSFEYTRRRSLFNNTNFSTLKDAYKPYMSNNPMLLNDDNTTPAFTQHNMLKASIMARISFGQTYRTRPNGRETISNDKYPRVYLKYEKGFAASIDDYNFDHLSARVTYDTDFGDVGILGTNFRAGKFFNSEGMSFVDYRHFNGNQTHVGRSERYLNVFNFLPYYTHSTDNQYLETHLEHHFNGYLTNSVPLFNKLNYYLVAGYHALAMPDRNPYMEFTIGLDNVGWGKFRLLRIDYIRSYEGKFLSDGVVFGLTFIDFLE